MIQRAAERSPGDTGLRIAACGQKKKANEC
jgi:hypothetical protein